MEPEMDPRSIGFTDEESIIDSSPKSTIGIVDSGYVRAGVGG